MVLYALAPFLLPAYELRNRLSGRGAGGVWPRLQFGLKPMPENDLPVIWCHAVSVGETLALQPVLGQLQKQLAAQWVISTVTRTGDRLARQRLAADRFIFFPLDFPGACRRVLKALHPQIILYTETELWPNFIAGAARQGVRQALVNGRISDRSFAGYQRWRHLFAPALRQLQLLAMQTEEDAERVIALGADPDRVKVSGNTKFDIINDLATCPPHPLTEETAPYWVAGSTHRGEEEKILEVQQRFRAKLRLVIAPRHPHRVAEVTAVLERGKWGYQLLSDGAPWSSEIMVIDTIGDLASFYQFAEFVFLGGSWVRHGGQNMLEPAAFGVPVFYGPYTDNFREAVALLSGHGGETVNDPNELFCAARRLCEKPSERDARGAAARAILQQRAGASANIAKLIGGLCG